jgi:hypothetical protein
MAASSTPVIELWNDIVNNRLIVGPVGTGWDAQEFTFSAAKIYQGSKLSFRWYPIKPSGLTDFVQVPVEGITLDVAIGPRAGAEAALARQNSWTNSGQGYLEATLNLNTTEMNTAVGSADSLSSYFEIEMSYGGDARPTYQEAITIISRVIGPAGAVSLPTAAVEYLTAAQIRAEFVAFVNNAPGATIELTSPDGTRLRIMGCTNDGAAQDDIV